MLLGNAEGDINVTDLKNNTVKYESVYKQYEYYQMMNDSTYEGMNTDAIRLSSSKAWVSMRTTDLIQGFFNIVFYLHAALQQCSASRNSYVGKITVCRELQPRKALSEISTSEVGKIRLVRAVFSK